MDLIDDIRRLYPLPIPCPTDDRKFRDAYCVGGALCAYQSQSQPPLFVPFPSVEALAQVLPTMNRHLTPGRAHEFAEVITTLNDADHMDLAWIAADLAMTYTPKE